LHGDELIFNDIGCNFDFLTSRGVEDMVIYVSYPRLPLPSNPILESVLVLLTRQSYHYGVA